MSFLEPICAAEREVVEIDVLLRALTRLRHWSAAAQARRLHRGDRGERLLASARRLRDEAWSDSLAAAYLLFEIDAIHQAWIDSAGSRHD